MTLEELKEKVYHKVQVLSEQSDEGQQWQDGAAEFYTDWTNDFMQLINQHVKEVIGEDEHVYGLADAKYKQCPYCDCGEGDLHGIGCKFMFEDFRNKLKAEQRKRAGL